MAFHLLIGIHSCENRPCPVAKNIHQVLEEPYQKIQDAIKETMEGITLESMLGNFHKILERFRKVGYGDIKEGRRLLFYRWTVTSGLFRL